MRFLGERKMIKTIPNEKEKRRKRMVSKKKKDKAFRWMDPDFGPDQLKDYFDEYGRGGKNDWYY